MTFFATTTVKTTEKATLHPTLRPAPKTGIKTAGENIGHTVNHTENHTVNTVKAILKILTDNPSVTIAELCVMTGKARPTINEHIAHLKAKNRIRRVGPDKGGHWEVIG